jgi:hypothetical protein
VLVSGESNTFVHTVVLHGERYSQITKLNRSKCHALAVSIRDFEIPRRRPPTRSAFLFTSVSRRRLLDRLFVTTMAASIEPTWWAALFRPTNRCRDAVRELTGNDSYELPHRLTEVELLPDLSPEHVLATDITYEDFCHFLGDEKLVWMGPGVYICDAYCSHPSTHPFVLGSSSRKDPHLRVYAATGPGTAAATTATCDFLVRLLATMKENDAFVNGRYGSSVPVSISGRALSRFFQESQDNLREVTLGEMILNEEHIRALATESRTNMEVILTYCKLFHDPGCHAAFVEYLHRDGGPIQLNSCEIDGHVLAAALEGNSRVTRLNIDRTTSDAEKDVMFRSLVENKGLVELDLLSHTINDENWTLLCHSVKAHPTLTVLDLRDTSPRAHQYGARMVLSNEQKAQRTRILAAMVEENRVLHTIRLQCYEKDEQIYAESILPRLETNLYRPRVLGIKKVDIAVRRALLGLALQTKSVRSKSNLLWMFLSGNQDVVLQSDEESAAVLQSDEESDVLQSEDETG